MNNALVHSGQASNFASSKPRQPVQTMKCSQTTWRAATEVAMRLYGLYGRKSTQNRGLPNIMIHLPRAYIGLLCRRDSAFLDASVNEHHRDLALSAGCDALRDQSFRWALLCISSRRTVTYKCRRRAAMARYIQCDTEGDMRWVASLSSGAFRHRLGHSIRRFCLPLEPLQAHTTNSA